MGAVVRREVRGETLLVAGVVTTTLGVVFLRMFLSPPTHGLASFLRIASYPLAGLLATSFWIPVGHRCDLANCRRRGNGSPYKMMRPTRSRLCCGGRIRTFGLWVMSPTSYRCSTPRYSF